jgi:diguanylate cyclase (GGDEF)-like protein
VPDSQDSLDPRASLYQVLLKQGLLALALGLVLLAIWFYSIGLIQPNLLTKALLGSVLFLALPLFVVSFGLLRQINRSLAAVTDAARKLSLGEWREQIPVDHYRETGLLGERFQTLAHTILEQRREYEKRSIDLSKQVNIRTRELREASERAVQMSMVDPLTKLPNRAALARQLHNIIRQIKNTRNSIALLFVDIDHFKRLNDSLGHEIGDAVLKHMAQILSRNLPEGSLVARLGGDEFVVVLGKMLTDDAQQITDTYITHLFDDLQNKIQFDQFSTVVTISCGAALYPRDAFDVASLLRAADSAMYVAKEGGRARAEWFSQTHVTEQNKKIDLEQDLRQAIAEQQFTLYYQPQVSLIDNRPSGVEALVRWRHPERGMVSPAEFIPLAEENGLIVSMGLGILEAACAQAARWRAQGMPSRIAVNLSVRQLEQQEWLSQLDRIIQKYNLPPFQIELEVTETAISRNPEKMAETLQAMSNKGFILTLDDFGTGYSSLNYLARLPFQNVKIDRQFIMDLENPSSYKIVQSIIALGHALNMRIVAEGVETPKQYKTMRDLGCDEVQGFYVSKPLPPEELIKWWREHDMAQDELFSL